LVKLAKKTIFDIEASLKAFKARLSSKRIQRFTRT